MSQHSIICPQCFRVSYNWSDIEARYCGACKMFHVDMLRLSDAEKLTIWQRLIDNGGFENQRDLILQYADAIEIARWKKEV